MTANETQTPSNMATSALFGVRKTLGNAVLRSLCAIAAYVQRTSVGYRATRDCPTDQRILNDAISFGAGPRMTTTSIATEPTPDGKFRVVESRPDGFTVVGVYSSQKIADQCRDLARLGAAIRAENKATN